MKSQKFLLAAALVLASLQLQAGALEDFLSNLNVQARADMNGFSLRVASQFNVGDADVRAVISSVPDPADAFMVFHLSQITHRPPAEIIRIYRGRGHRGWGEMAQEMGIKPGSPEFQDLKRGNLRLRERGEVEHGRNPKPGHGQGHGRGHGKGHDQQRGKPKQDGR